MLGRSVPFSRRTRNCSGERTARHSPSDLDTGCDIVEEAVENVMPINGRTTALVIWKVAGMRVDVMWVRKSCAMARRIENG